MTREIPLTQARIALVDDDDFERLMAVGKWQLATCGGRHYAQHGGNGWCVRMHVLLMGGIGMVDHINGDGLDNRRSNLRLATSSQNGANIPAPSHNTSGYKGVSLYKRTGRWRAYAGANARHLGYFATAEEAARAYDAAATETWGNFARLNFPRQDI